MRHHPHVGRQGARGRLPDSAQAYRTGGAEVTIHDSAPRNAGGSPDYQLNQLVIRAEMRAEIAVERPAGFVRVGPA